MSSTNDKKIIHSGERLKIARKSFDLSQGKFAKRLGFPSYQTIRYLEIGRKKFRPHIAKLIQCEFGISAEWLLKGKGDMLIDIAQKEPIDVQKIVEDLVSETSTPYEKQLPEDKKIAEIIAYIEDVAKDSQRVKRYFIKQFIKCFEEDFMPWTKGRYHDTKDVKKSDGEK